MKILLINPPQVTKYPQPPLGLAIMAAVLENSGYDVKILDLPALGLSEISFSGIIQGEKPDVVGITAMTPTINSAISIATKVKEVDASIMVILGGHHATILPEETLRSIPDIDIVVREEGEQTMLQLVKVLDEGSSNMEHVLGITYRNGSYVRSTPTRPILDLDALPFPAFHLLPTGKYCPHPPFGRLSPFMPIITSRGCPYRCIFCSKSVFGKKYRAHSRTYVVNEIQYLIEKFHVKEIKFYDDVFTMNKKRAIEICAELKERKIDIPWTCETRVNLVDRKLLRIMKAAGCYAIAYGVESGNQGILNNLKKDITTEQALKAFELTHETGIETVAYFMIGSPGETPETIKETIEFARKLDPDFAQFSITTPYPGTELFDLVSREGWMPEEWDKYVYAKLDAGLSTAFEIESFSRQELEAWNKKAYISFYLRLSYIWKRLSKMRTLGGLRTNIAGLRMLIDFAK